MLLSPFSLSDQLKLLTLICAIPYAEEKIRTHGKSYLNSIERFLSLIKLKNRLCQTLGTFCFGVEHHKRFNKTKSAFRKLLQDDARALPYIMEYILYDLGIHKPPEHLFAEYNLHSQATLIAALQKALNCCIDCQLLEDGLFGRKTEKALQGCGEKLGVTLQLKTQSEEEIENVLQILKTHMNIHVEPFVPSLVIKFGWYRFYNHTDVPGYVKWAMEAYDHLSL